MNTTIATNYETAADFIAATVPPTTQAYRLGRYAAELGEDCLPQKTFIMRHDIREFIRGYRAAIAKANESQVQQ